MSFQWHQKLAEPFDSKINHLTEISMHDPSNINVRANATTVKKT
jgi:hypothetical protein